MKLSHRVTMLLLDMQEHRLGDMYEYLCESIDPARAVRTYLKRRSNGRRRVDRVTDISLEDQVKKGSLTIIYNTIRELGKDNIIVYVKEWSSEEWASTSFMLTPEGLDSLRTKKDALGAILKEATKLFKEGRGILEFRFEPSTISN